MKRNKNTYSQEKSNISEEKGGYYESPRVVARGDSKYHLKKMGG